MDFQDLSNLFNWRSVKIASIRKISFRPDGQSIGVKYDFDHELRVMKILKKNVMVQKSSRL